MLETEVGKAEEQNQNQTGARTKNEFADLSKWTLEERIAATPPEDLTVSEWSAKYRELNKGSAVTGLYMLEMVPFFVPIMDACASHLIDEITVVKPAQIGGTDAFVVNVCGYYTHQDPSHIMVSLADQETASYVCVEKVTQMFRQSSALKHLYNKKMVSKNYILTPNGARIDFVWASSVSKLASRPKRIVIADEVDKPGYTRVSKEASSLSLLTERTKSFPSGYFKHIFLSTPTTTEGNIYMLMKSADIIYDWHVPCPFCGTFQPLRWNSKYTYGFEENVYRSVDNTYLPFGQVEWEGGSSATRSQIKDSARYKCGTCSKFWTNEEKNIAVAKGQMVGRTEPDGSERKVAFHVNRLLSPINSGRLDNLIVEWNGIFKNPKEKQPKILQGFINSALAEPFMNMVAIKDNVNVHSILKAKVDLQPQTVPEKAIVLVCFIDVQKYDFWFAVRAFAEDFTSWLIHYGRLTVWEDVETLLFETSYPQIGKSEGMKIWRAGIDTGGSESRYESVSATEFTYQWLRDNQRGKGCRVWGTKGSPGFVGAEMIKTGKRLDYTPSGKPLPGGLQLMLLDTFKLKTVFRTRLGAAIEGNALSRPAYLHSGTTEEYASHILAEELVVNDKGIEMWRNVKNKPNHLFDCEIGCVALVDPEWPGGGLNLLKNSRSSNQNVAGRRIISHGITI